MVDLKKYICTNPFEYTEIMEDRQTFCCPQWLDKYIESRNIDYSSSWTGKEAKDARKSMIDGSFQYCSTSKCPHLATLVNTGKLSRGPIKKVSSVDLNKLKKDSQLGPKFIKFIFDQACNLACPSCRNTFIKNSEEIYINSKHKLDKLSSAYSNSVEKISMSGAGDPFYSTTFFEFMKDLDLSKFPNLNHIHLHTNAILWNRHNWKKIANSHSLIKSTEISIDAAKESTYKVVRKGGNFNTLTKNLKFIETLDIKDFNFSFVTQRDNYSELVEFVEYIESIFMKQINRGIVTISFTKIFNWGNLSNEEYNNMAIWKDTHPDHSKFLLEVDKLNKLKKPYIISNLF